MQLVSKLNQNLPVCPTHADQTCSTDDTSLCMFEGEDSDKSKWRIVSKKDDSSFAKHEIGDNSKMKGM